MRNASALAVRRAQVLAVAFCAAVLLSGCPEPVRVEPPPVVATPPPLPTPPPPPYVPNRRLGVGKMFNGAQFTTKLETELGRSATAVREDPASYNVEVKVQVKIPTPHHDLAALTKLNARLPELLPALPALLETAKISPLWDDLQRLKVAQLQRALNRLDDLPSRHNLFDCETILELQQPASKRRALLIQADMDTDDDGSDSDRLPDVDGASATFQPFTSYRWAKKTPRPSSFIPPRETKLQQTELELGTPSLSAARSKDLKETNARLKSEISDLKKYSFLVGTVDPFIVLPLSMFGKKSPFAAAVGDYCVLIHGGALYPAIVGDAGPAYKQGEASLRICKQLNPRASVNNRPENDLKITYLVFPGTAEKTWDAPDLEKWRTRCDQLLQELGGYTGELFAWEDLTKPKPPVEPAPPAPAEAVAPAK